MDGTAILVYLIRLCINVLTLLSLPFYFVTQRPWLVRCRSRRPAPFLQLEQGNGYQLCRNRKEMSRLHRQLTVEHGVDTLVKAIQFAARKYADKKALGTREVLGRECHIHEDGTLINQLALGDYTWKTYQDMYDEVVLFSRGMGRLGLTQRSNVVLFSETRAEWLTAAFGCMKRSLPIVTLYGSLSDEALVHAIVETGVDCIVTSQELLPRLLDILPHINVIRTVIVFEDQTQPLEPDTFATATGLRLHPYRRVIEMGRFCEPSDCLPAADDTAIIMYTSGTSGAAKGVALSHRNVLSSLGSYLDGVPIGEDDVSLAYLPLANVVELVVETQVLISGGAIGYSSAVTLTDCSASVKSGSVGDATVLRPTIILGVPLVTERLYRSIRDDIDARSKLLSLLIHFFINYKIYWTGLGYSTPVLDRFLLRPKLASILGGKVKFYCHGGAALAPETQTFIGAVLCCSIYHGYVLSETSGCATLMCSGAGDLSAGSVGIPLTCCYVKLVDWPPGSNPTLADSSHSRGEIHIGGPNVAQGYYNLPQLTQQDFYEEDGRRWFRTGDIGEIPLATGRLRIIGRKKDLIKNQHGQYIALSKVESVLRTCPLIDNICVFADPTQLYTVAVVSPNVERLQLEARLKKFEFADEDWHQVCSSPVLEQIVLKQIARHPSIKSGHLQKFEIPYRVRLVPDSWTTANGLVTHSLKLRRQNIYIKYRTLIDLMYQV